MLINARDDKAVMVLKAEAAAFLEVLAQTRNLSAVDCAALVEFSSQIQWQQCDANAVLRALCSSDSTPSRGRDHKTERKRRWMQGYTAFLVYLTESDWTLLLDPNVQQIVKLDKILYTLLSLGARCPTEPTTKRVTSMVLLLSEPPDKLMRMPYTLKQAFHSQVKKRFQELARTAQRPLAHLAELPTDPAALKRLHPSVYNAAFSKEGPTGCKIDMPTLV